MFVLERGQPTQQLIEVRVGDDRRVAHVVAELVFSPLVGQFAPTTTDFRRDGISLCRAHLGRLSEDADSAPAPVSPRRRRAAVRWRRPNDVTAGRGSRWPGPAAGSAGSRSAPGHGGYC